jgi:hypothetical protein
MDICEGGLAIFGAGDGALQRGHKTGTFNWRFCSIVIA